MRLGLYASFGNDLQVGQAWLVNKRNTLLPFDNAGITMKQANITRPTMIPK